MTPVTDPMPKPAETKSSSIGSARSALISILGEFVAPYRRPVRTAALLYVLTGLGFGEPASRQAIARAGASGLITAGATVGKRSGVSPSRLISSSSKV